MARVRDFYDFINENAPFKVCDKYDNVGLLVGDMEAEVSGVCLCLDITNDVIDEAIRKNANLIISHHPVIFNPLNVVLSNTPVYKMAENKINAVCAHTNADMAENGVSHMMQMLLEFPSTGEILEEIFPDGTGYGLICEIPLETTATALAETCKSVFHSKVVRYTDGGKPIKRIGLCSGSGGSALEFAIEKNCDALITGDIKHSIWISALNSRFTLIDAGHFYTENIFCSYLSGELCKKFYNDSIFIADNSVDPCCYVL